MGDPPQGGEEGRGFVPIMQICALFPSSLSFLTFSQSNSHFTQTEEREIPQGSSFSSPLPSLSDCSFFKRFQVGSSFNCFYPSPQKSFGSFSPNLISLKMCTFFFWWERGKHQKGHAGFVRSKGRVIYIAARGGDERFKLKCRNRRPGFPELSPFSPFPFLSPFLPPFFKVSGKFDNERKSQRG